MNHPIRFACIRFKQIIRIIYQICFLNKTNHEIEHSGSDQSEYLFQISGSFYKKRILANEYPYPDLYSYNPYSFDPYLEMVQKSRLSYNRSGRGAVNWGQLFVSVILCFTP